MDKHKKRHIVHITPEVTPFYKNGGLGDVLGALPIYLEDERNHNIVISIYYKKKTKCLDQSIKKSHSFTYQDMRYDFYSLHTRRQLVDYYFIKLEDSFVFSEIEGVEGNSAYSEPSMLLPYFYFAKAVSQLIVDNKLAPDYIFCHDWHTAGFFGYIDILNDLKKEKDLKTISLIHNFAYQGELFEDIYPLLDKAVIRELEVIFSRFGHASLLSLALKNSDFVATVSHRYAMELVDKKAPHTGLDYLDLCSRKVFSFLNGTDLSLWNPQKSPFLPISYDFSSLEGKRKIKQMIFQEFGVAQCNDTFPPLVLMLSRLTSQKGIGLFIDYYKDRHTIVRKMEVFLELGARLLICGQPAGGTKGIINESFSYLSKKFPGRFVYLNRYSEKLAHRLLAAADILIAPSLFEPCGLIQLYAMAFGAVPLVRSVGGMKDTVCCYFENREKATGFHMTDLSWDCLYTTMKRALHIYYTDPSEWYKIVERGMKADFSWDRMKNQYLRFFDSIEKNPAISYDSLKNFIRESWL